MTSTPQSPSTRTPQPPSTRGDALSGIGAAAPDPTRKHAARPAASDVPATVAVLVGSLRAESYARRIALEVIDMLPEPLEGRLIRIDDLPLYNADYDDPAAAYAPLPEPYTRFRAEIADAAGVIFVTSENNRTIPAVMKNAIDVGSKPTGKAVWQNLPAGLISHSVGRMGGYSAQKNLRLALSYFDMPTPGQPEVFLGNSPSLFGQDGTLVADTRDFVADYVERFSTLVART